MSTETQTNSELPELLLLDGGLLEAFGDAVSRRQIYCKNQLKVNTGKKYESRWQTALNEASTLAGWWSAVDSYMRRHPDYADRVKLVLMAEVRTADGQRIDLHAPGNVWMGDGDERVADSDTVGDTGDGCNDSGIGNTVTASDMGATEAGQGGTPIQSCDGTVNKEITDGQSGNNCCDDAADAGAGDGCLGGAGGVGCADIECAESAAGTVRTADCAVDVSVLPAGAADVVDSGKDVSGGNGSGDVADRTDSFCVVGDVAAEAVTADAGSELPFGFPIEKLNCVLPKYVSETVGSPRGRLEVFVLVASYNPDGWSLLGFRKEPGTEWSVRFSRWFAFNELQNAIHTADEEAKNLHRVAGLWRFGVIDYRIFKNNDGQTEKLVLSQEDPVLFSIREFWMPDGYTWTEKNNVSICGHTSDAMAEFEFQYSKLSFADDKSDVFALIGDTSTATVPDSVNLPEDFDVGLLHGCKLVHATRMLGTPDGTLLMSVVVRVFGDGHGWAVFFCMRTPGGGWSVRGTHLEKAGDAGRAEAVAFAEKDTLRVQKDHSGWQFGVVDYRIVERDGKAPVKVVLSQTGPEVFSVSKFRMYDGRTWSTTGPCEVLSGSLSSAWDEYQRTWKSLEASVPAAAAVRNSQTIDVRQAAVVAENANTEPADTDGDIDTAVPMEMPNRGEGHPFAWDDADMLTQPTPEALEAQKGVPAVVGARFRRLSDEAGVSRSRSDYAIPVQFDPQLTLVYRELVEGYCRGSSAQCERVGRWIEKYGINYRFGWHMHSNFVPGIFLLRDAMYIAEATLRACSAAASSMGSEAVGRIPGVERVCDTGFADEIIFERACTRDGKHVVLPITREAIFRELWDSADTLPFNRNAIVTDAFDRRRLMDRCEGWQSPSAYAGAVMMAMLPCPICGDQRSVAVGVADTRIRSTINTGMMLYRLDHADNPVHQLHCLNCGVTVPASAFGLQAGDSVYRRLMLPMWKRHQAIVRSGVFAAEETEVRE